MVEDMLQRLLDSSVVSIWLPEASAISLGDSQTEACLPVDLRSGRTQAIPMEEE